MLLIIYRCSVLSIVLSNVLSNVQLHATAFTVYSLELVIGRVIGSFVLALILGLVLGLLFGVKYTRTYNIKQVNVSMTRMDLSKGTLYEEVNTDKNVELTQNISYETVKNIK